MRVSYKSATLLAIIAVGVALVTFGLLASYSRPGPFDVTIASAKSDPSVTTSNSLNVNGEAVCLSGTNNGLSSFSITDSLGLSWKSIDYVTGNNHALEGYYAIGSGSDTVSITASSAMAAILVTYCFNEPGGLGVDSKSVSSSGGNSASLSVRSSTSQTDELLVGFFTVSGTPAIIASSGYTVLQKTTSAPEILVESNLANAPENTNVTASLGAVENWSGLAFAIPLGNVTTTTSTSTSTSSLTASSSTLSSSTSSTASTSSTSTGSSGSPALDGTCNKENTRVTTEACSLSTSHADDILIAILGTASGSGSSSITDSLGLRWSNLASYHASSASHSIFIYWAVSPNLLSGDTVSTTQSQSTNLNLYVLAFQDVNLASPFDGTPVESAGDSASPSLTISNHNANEFVIGAFIVSNSGIAIKPESGYTGLPYVTVPSNFIEYTQPGAAQSNVASATINAAEEWAGVAFVLAGSASSGATTTTTSSSSTGSVTLGGNACFSQGKYNPAVNIITSAQYECSATLNANQTITQYMLRSSTLAGSFVLTVNATQSVTVTVSIGGVVVFSKTGTMITYEGTIGQNQLLSVTIANTENSKTSYDLGLSF